MLLFRLTFMLMLLFMFMIMLLFRFTLMTMLLFMFMIMLIFRFTFMTMLLFMFMIMVLFRFIHVPASARSLWPTSAFTCRCVHTCAALSVHWPTSVLTCRCVHVPTSAFTLAILRIDLPMNSFHVPTSTFTVNMFLETCFWTFNTSGCTCKIGHHYHHRHRHRHHHHHHHHHAGLKHPQFPCDGGHSESIELVPKRSICAIAPSTLKAD